MRKIIVAGLVGVGIALAGVASVHAQDDNLPSEQKRAQFRDALDQRSSNWIVRYGDNGVHVMFVDQSDPQLACEAADQVDGFTLKSATAAHQPTESC